MRILQLIVSLGTFVGFCSMAVRIFTTKDLRILRIVLVLLGFILLIIVVIIAVVLAGLSMFI